MATTEQGTTYRHHEQMDKLRISNGRVQAAPLGPPPSDHAGAASDVAEAETDVVEAEPEGAEDSADNAGAVLSPDLRRNFIIPPKERALECIAVLLNLARTNLGTSQRNLHAARRSEDDNGLAHWKWESLHWLRRCGKWSNHKRKVESR
ncbi:MAG: hypothetical protein GTO67_03575 [Gammaproteobacteria bacterium]|nr:hypothetical protein [Gammaproteobacteria bacterium]NIN37808.1 hypothetical protein [Gammaproteobacteria bacterium]NIO23468.1 hypothetical protein [Gammaproteobacteria bacterium]NIO64084.1 hypothetical protein [Gammaproteobacteria bacterium]NIP47053.1 hypothetical protein [Gammaproteobacteria bacterium]